MTIIKDKSGREWVLSLTIGSVKRLRSSLNVDLLRLLDPRTEGGIPLLTELETNIELLVDVIHGLVGTQADDAGIDADAFAELLDGDLFAAFHAAFWKEVGLFSLGLPRGRVVAEAINKQSEIVLRHVEQATREVAEMTIPGIRSTNSLEA